MEVKEFIVECIKWCNSNEGFLTAILSVVTMGVSVLAIWVSVRTARLPYKKAVAITATPVWSDEKPCLTVTVVNTGNIGLLLCKGSIFDKKTNLHMGFLNSLVKKDQNGHLLMLKPNTAIVENVELYDGQETINKIFKQLSADNLVTIRLQDYSGWKYETSKGFGKG